MRVLLLVVGLIFGATGRLANPPTMAKEREEIAAVRQKANGLDVLLVAPKPRYKRGEQLKLLVMLVNSGKNHVYVLGAMEWGYSASLLFNIRDASGREIEPMGFPDDQTHISPDDKSAFVKLLPNHFLGTNFFAPLDVLNLNKPGKYAIFVEYHSPISTADVELKPFFGKENGTIKSNVVYVEILR